MKLITVPAKLNFQQPFLQSLCSRDISYYVEHAEMFLEYVFHDLLLIKVQVNNIYLKYIFFILQHEKCISL